MRINTPTFKEIIKFKRVKNLKEKSVYFTIFYVFFIPSTLKLFESLLWSVLSGRRKQQKRGKIILSLPFQCSLVYKNKQKYFKGNNE